MKVKLLQYTKDAEKIIAASAKLCYSSSGIDDITENLTDENTEKFLNHLLSLGHESPFEHATFTFGIEGVSRSLLAQITRHRIASFSVKSQRYVAEGQFEYVIPTEIENLPEAKEKFIATMEAEQNSYNELTDILYKKHYADYINDGKDEKTAARLAEKKAIEDARYVLPNACCTSMIVTFNTRSLWNFFEKRCCNRAQWEIRELADKMLYAVKEVAPLLFKKSGPPCLCGPCPEGKMSCGEMQQMRNKYLGDNK